MGDRLVGSHRDFTRHKSEHLVLDGLVWLQCTSLEIPTSGLPTLGGSTRTLASALSCDGILMRLRGMLIASGLVSRVKKKTLEWKLTVISTILIPSRVKTSKVSQVSYVVETKNQFAFAHLWHISELSGTTVLWLLTLTTGRSMSNPACWVPGGIPRTVDWLPEKIWHMGQNNPWWTWT